MNNKKWQNLIKWFSVFILILAMITIPNVEINAATTNGTWGSVNWTFDEEGTLTFTSGGAFITQHPYSHPWHSYREDVKKIVFTEKVIAPRDSGNLFYTFANLTSIEGLELLDTSNVTHMNSMFAGCTSLESVDVSTWDVSKVESMIAMFGLCKSLEVIPVTNWNTERLKTVDGMFTGCDELEFIDISMWNVSNLENAQSMFYSCDKLASLDISNWNTSSLQRWERFFYQCTSLKSITLGNKSSLNAPQDVFLPKIDRTSGSYTGRWVGLTTGNTYEDSDAFMKNYDGSIPDTYVWQTYTTVSFESNSGTLVDSQTVLQGETLLQPEDPTREAYAFGGWHDETLSEAWDFERMPMSDMTLYAKWEAISSDLDNEETGDVIFEKEVEVSNDENEVRVITEEVKRIVGIEVSDNSFVRLPNSDQTRNNALANENNIQSATERLEQGVETKDNSSIGIFNVLFIAATILLVSRKFQKE